MAYIGYELYKNPQVFLADTIGTHAIFITKEGFVPLVRSIPASVNQDMKMNGGTGKSSTKTPVNVPKWAFPSGSPDPTEAKILIPKELLSRNVKAVHKELTKSVFRALHHMLGLKISSSEPTFLFVVHYDKHLNNKPELIFIIPSTITCFEIAGTFKKSDAKSNYNLSFIEIADFKQPSRDDGKLPLCQIVEKVASRQNVATDVISELLKTTLKLTQQFDGIDLATVKI